MGRGGIFIIGVVGQTDTNIFEITATISTPDEITFLTPTNVLSPSIIPSRIEYSLKSGVYRYFAMKIDPRQRGKIILNIDGISNNNNEKNNNKNNNNNTNSRSKATSGKNVQNLVSSQIAELQCYGRGDIYFDFILHI